MNRVRMRTAVVPARRRRPLAAAAVGLAVVAAGVVGPASPAAAASECTAWDQHTWGQCIDGVNSNTVDTVTITAMITLDDQWATKPITGVVGKTIQGQGQATGFRYGNVQNGSAIYLGAVEGVTVQNLSINGTYSMNDTSDWQQCNVRDGRGGGCEPLLEVGGTVDANGNATNNWVTVQNVTLTNSRGTAAAVHGAKQFRWLGNTIDNAAEMGLHLGYDQPQNRVTYTTVDNSTFRNVRVNALFMQTYGTYVGDNTVQYSRFYGNHRAGIYPCGGERCSGGQIFVADRSVGVTIHHVVVADGRCDICTGDDSHGIELSETTNVSITDSEIRANAGASIYGNWNMTYRNLEIGRNCIRYNETDPPGFPTDRLTLEGYHLHDNQIGDPGCTKNLG